MMCGKAQALIIRQTCARTREKKNYFRRQLREHVKQCKFCSKNWVGAA